MQNKTLQRHEQLKNNNIAIITLLKCRIACNICKSYVNSEIEHTFMSCLKYSLCGKRNIFILILIFLLSIIVFHVFFHNFHYICFGFNLKQL